MKIKRNYKNAPQKKASNNQRTKKQTNESVWIFHNLDSQTTINNNKRNGLDSDNFGFWYIFQWIWVEFSVFLWPKLKLMCLFSLFESIKWFRVRFESNRLQWHHILCVRDDKIINSMVNHVICTNWNPNLIVTLNVKTRKPTARTFNWHAIKLFI